MRRKRFSLCVCMRKCAEANESLYLKLCYRYKRFAWHRVPRSECMTSILAAAAVCTTPRYPYHPTNTIYTNPPIHLYLTNIKDILTLRQQNANHQPSGIRQPHLFSLEIFACVPHRLVELLAHIQCRVVPRRRQNTIIASTTISISIKIYQKKKYIKIEKSQHFGQLERYILCPRLVPPSTISSLLSVYLIFRVLSVQFSHGNLLFLNLYVQQLRPKHLNNSIFRVCVCVSR